MRWIVLVLLIWLVVLVQTTLGRLATIEVAGVGTVGPDLLAGLAVFVALYARRATDAMIAAAAMGFALDLSTAGAGGSLTVVGPMAIAYAAAARGVFAVREAFFRDRLSTRAVLTLALCLVAHGLWVTMQAVLARGAASWGEYVRMLAEAGLISLYSALVATATLSLFARLGDWLLVAPPTRARRTR